MKYETRTTITLGTINTHELTSKELLVLIGELRMGIFPSGPNSLRMALIEEILVRLGVPVREPHLIPVEREDGAYELFFWRPGIYNRKGVRASRGEVVQYMKTLLPPGIPFPDDFRFKGGQENPTNYPVKKPTMLVMDDPEPSQPNPTEPEPVPEPAPVKPKPEPRQERGVIKPTKELLNSRCWRYGRPVEFASKPPKPSPKEKDILEVMSLSTGKIWSNTEIGSYFSKGSQAIGYALASLCKKGLIKWHAMGLYSLRDSGVPTLAELHNEVGRIILPEDAHRATGKSVTDGGLGHRMRKYAQSGFHVRDNDGVFFVTGVVPERVIS